MNEAEQQEQRDRRRLTWSQALMDWSPVIAAIIKWLVENA